MAPSAGTIGTIYLLLGLAIGLLLVEPFRRPKRAESPWLVVTVIAFALWPLSLGIDYQLSDLEASILVWNGRYIAATVMCAGWILMAVAFFTRKRPARGLVAALGAYVAIDVIVVATSGVHSLVYTPETALVGTVLNPAYGPWFWLHTLVNYGLVLAATVAFGATWMRSGGVRRKQSGLLAFGVVPPAVANVATLAGVVQVPYDLTPIGLAATALLLTWAVYRVDLLDVVPIARERAVEEMRDAVVTLDGRNHVVDSNAAARALFDVEEDYVGMPATEFFAGVPDHVRERFEAEDDVQTQVSFRLGGADRHFSLSITPIEADDGGRVAVIRDVSPVVRREQALEERERELDLLRQVLTRVLTHNVRNALTTINGNAELLAESVDEPHDERARTIVETSETLLNISEKARDVERILDDADPLTYDLVRLVDDAVDDLAEEYPDVTFEVDGPEACEVTSSPGLDAAVLALLENAAGYNDPEDPLVAVAIDEDGPTLEIADRGPGIPEDEVAVLAAERETALRHGSGLGLWLVKWVADHSGADLTFTRSPEGTTVTMAFGGEGPDHVDLLG